MQTEMAVKIFAVLRQVASARCIAYRASKVLPVALVVALGSPLAGCIYPMSPRRDGQVRATAFRGTAGQGAGSIVSQAEVFEAACDIRGAVEAYRAALGTLNPNQPGTFGSGRREINWDAVPVQFTNVDNFPADFFNQPVTGRARGVVFSTPGSGFRVSDVNFTDLNQTYEDEFEFFSPVRTFISVGDPASSVDFFVAGTTTPATTTGFGAVFSDVDHPGSARLRLFDVAGHNLGTYLAPACPGGLSFVGVRFPDPIVARVDILSGFAPLGAESFDVSSGHVGPIRDLVIMDDFLYGEPVTVRGATASATSIAR
jgi:hypothetical protein